MTITVIFGPPASGKSRNAERLRQQFGCDRIIDNGDTAYLAMVGARPGDLVLITADEALAAKAFPNARRIPIEDALRAIYTVDNARCRGRALLTPAQLEHTNGLLGAWLGDRPVCTLAGAMVALERADHVDGVLRGLINSRLVETLLLKRGFSSNGVIKRSGEHETNPVFLHLAMLRHIELPLRTLVPVPSVPTQAPGPLTDDMILKAMAARPQGIMTYVMRNILAYEHGQKNLKTDTVRMRLTTLENEGKVTSRRWGRGSSIEWSLVR